MISINFQPDTRTTCTVHVHCTHTHRHKNILLRTYLSSSLSSFVYFFSPLCMHEPYKLLLCISITFATNSNSPLPTHIHTYTHAHTMWHLIKMFESRENTHRSCRRRRLPDETWKLDKFQITPFYQCQFLFVQRNSVHFIIHFIWSHHISAIEERKCNRTELFHGRRSGISGSCSFSLCKRNWSRNLIQFKLKPNEINWKTLNFCIKISNSSSAKWSSKMIYLFRRQTTLGPWGLFGVGTCSDVRISPRIVRIPSNRFDYFDVGRYWRFGSGSNSKFSRNWEL